MLNRLKYIIYYNLKITFYTLIFLLFIFFKVSLLDINEAIGNKAISELEIKYKLSSSRLLFIKCDVTNKIEFEGKYSSQ